MENKGFEAVEITGMGQNQRIPQDVGHKNRTRFRCRSISPPLPHHQHRHQHSHQHQLGQRKDSDVIERPGRRSPPVFRPQRLLHTISSALTPKPIHMDQRYSADSFMDTGGIKTGSMWHPVSNLVHSLQSFQKPRALSLDKATEQAAVIVKIPKPSVDHCGRFDIGHPTACDASIVDDPDTDSRARFVTGPTLQVGPTIVPSSADSSLVGRDDTCTTVNTLSNGRTCYARRRKSPVFMDEDHLGRPAYPHQKSNPVIVRINVSGERFHVFHTTLQKDPYVYSKMLEDAMWLPDEREYFFERDPGVFRFIHNYLRYGEVHLPTGLCGPLLEKELDEWGIPLGLDIQRCCLGPVISSKFKVDSLRKFENHLEPDIIKPSYWIHSPRWQAFRAKVWQVIDVAPRVIHHSTMKHRGSIDSNAFSITSRYDFPSRKASPSGDCLNDDDDDDDNDADATSTVRDYTRSLTNSVLRNQSLRLPLQSGEGLNQLLAVQPRLIINSLSKREKTIIRWARRLYVTYETLIVTAAVLVFMLSTVDQYRIPITADGSSSVIRNSSSNSVLSGARPAHMKDQVNTDTHTNRTSISLPIPSIVNMDIFFSVTITIDVLTRMVFCPAIRPWLFSLYTLIDILSLVPFYCELILYEMINHKAFVNANDWLVHLMSIEGYVVILKVFVVLRLFRVLRRHRGTRVLLYTIRTTCLDMCIIVILILESALFFGAAIYFTDDNFNNIPRGFWWAFITMSTVGYGDLVPTHTVGYVVAMVCVLTGTLLMSCTIPVLVNHFILYYDHADQLAMVKQMHRTARRKARSRNMSKYAQKALSSARVLMNATLNNAVAKVNSTIQLSARTTTEMKDPVLIADKKQGTGSENNLTTQK
ncbi:Potassium voltage-gated channel subfamily B member 2 [Fasciolopsis buskii]|uniref:Potassium voltage-gated channel subfamily B member 2 n=1 Tax=Fasciolopsis buskii TaxID=27845 RepID=A0A8E0RYJ9_9TREM|nr:Potassium voltage-gated channel subfamily B member 2 [Fasciolopsis buski]